MITQREYVAMIKREAKELHRSINKCFENEDQYIECDENGVNAEEEEARLEREEHEKELDEWYSSAEYQEELKKEEQDKEDASPEISFTPEYFDYILSNVKNENK